MSIRFSTQDKHSFGVLLSCLRGASRSRRKWGVRVFGRGSSDLRPGHIARPFWIRRNFLRECIGVEPLFDFGMAVGEGKATGAVMIICGHVSPRVLCIQHNEEIAIINRVGMLIEKNKGLGR